MVDTNKWDPEKYKQGSYLQDSIASKVLARYPFPSNATILDIGCGDGRLTAEISKKVPNGSILAIDRSQEMIEYCKSQYSHLPNVQFQQLDAETIDYAAKFDHVISFFCLHWIRDKLNIYKRIYSALQKNGKILILEPSKSPQAKYIMQTTIAELLDPTQGENYDLPVDIVGDKELHETVSQAGFSIDQLETLPTSVEFPSSHAFRKFIAALPLLNHVFPAEQIPEALDKAKAVYEQYCLEHFQGKNMFELSYQIAKAHKSISTL